MINDHENTEAHALPHDHFGSVINHHPHSDILVEMRRLIENNPTEDDSQMRRIPQMKSAMKNQQILNRGASPFDRKGVSFSNSQRIRIHGDAEPSY